MIEITTYDFYNETDNCGNTPVACLNINGTRIELCQECIDELTEELNKFNNTIFCYKCKEFIMSDSGWHYGGSCKLKARENNINLNECDAGYICCKDCMDTCENADPIGE